MRYSLTPEFRTAVQLGKIPGWAWKATRGHNPDIDAGTEDVWGAGGVLVWPTTAAAVSVASSSANDAAAGTGARELYITGLDAAYQPITERIQLNGVGAVLTAQLFLRVNAAYVTLVGSLGQNDGAVTGTVGGNTQFAIAAAFGQTRRSQFTVPAGTTVILDQLLITEGRAAASDLEVNGMFRLYNRPAAAYEGWRTEFSYDLFEGAVASVSGGVGIILPALTDWRVQGISTGANLAVSVLTAGYIVDNSAL